MDVPAAADEASIILKDASCVVRFVHEGSACGFTTKILDWCDMGLPFFRVSWPEDVHVLRVRKHTRIPVRLACEFEYPEGKDHGEMHDLSTGGCGFVAKRFLKDGTPLRLSFTLPDGVPMKRLRATVRSSRPHGKEVMIGCSFLADAEGLNDGLVFFVTSTLARTGLQPASRQRVLFVHPADRDLRTLIQAFENAGTEIFTAHNAVDAFYRLRMAPPKCIVLDVTQSVVPVEVLCAAIRQTPGFEEMPLFLVGECSDGATLVSACGAKEWFPPEHLKAPDAIVDAYLRLAAETV